MRRYSDVGIDRARGLIATLASDADNLFLILSAKALNSNLSLAARVAEEASEPKLRRAGADFVFAPYNSTGHRMAQALLKPHVQQFLDFTTQSMGLDAGIEQVRVADRSAFVESSLAEMQCGKNWASSSWRFEKPVEKCCLTRPPNPGSPVATI